MIPAIRRLLIIEDSKLGKSDSKLPSNNYYNLEILN